MPSLRPVRRVAELGSIGVIATLMNDSRLRLLRILFFSCETLLVGSSVVLDVLWRFYRRPGLAAGGGLLSLVFVVSFVTLLVVCFCLRRAARPLAIIGWLSAFAMLTYALKPEL